MADSPAMARLLAQIQQVAPIAPAPRTPWGAGEDPMATLEALVQVPGTARRAWLQARHPDLVAAPYVLTGEDTPQGRAREGVNLLWDPTGQATVWIGAHYDLVPTTIQGALDNSASVAALSELLRTRALPPGVGVAFWDGEEATGGGAMDGSSVHGAAVRAAAPADGPPPVIIALDVLGQGTLSVSERPWTAWTTTALPGVPQRKTPPGDDYGLRHAGVANALLVGATAEERPEAWGLLHSPADHISLVDPVAWRRQVAALPGVMAAVVAAQVTHADALRASVTLGDATTRLQRYRELGAFLAGWEQGSLDRPVPAELQAAMVEGRVPDALLGPRDLPPGMAAQRPMVQATAGQAHEVLVATLPEGARVFTLPEHMLLIAALPQGPHRWHLMAASPGPGDPLAVFGSVVTTVLAAAVPVGTTLTVTYDRPRRSAADAPVVGHNEAPLTEAPLDPAAGDGFRVTRRVVVAAGVQQDPRPWLMTPAMYAASLADAEGGPPPAPRRRKRP